MQNGIKQKGFENMKKIKIFIYTIILFTLLPVPYTMANPVEESTYSHKWEEDELIGGFSQISKTFYIADNMDVSDFNISLKIKPSPTLVGDLSSISVLLNGLEIDSLLIKDLDSSEPLIIKVPATSIHKGQNTLSIKGFLKSTRERCEINPDINWLIIEKDSYFKFDYLRTPGKYLNDIFDSTYYFDGLEGQINIIVADKLAEENYSQISSLSALLGWVNKNKGEDLKIKTLRYSEIEGLAKESIIIGTPDQLKSLDESLFTDKIWEAGAKQGLIALRQIANKRHFIIMTSNNDQLGVLNQTLGKKSSLAQMKTETYILDENKMVKNKEFNTNPSLKELGYETVSQVGNGIKDFNYYFTIPASKTLTDDNKLSFAYNYSSLSDLDEAYVIASINGEKFLTKELSKESTKGTLEFSIPEQYYDYTGFNINLSFNLKPNVENCVTQTFENVWIRIDSDNSRFDLDLKNRQEYTLLSSYGLLQNEDGYLDGNISLDNLNEISLDNISNFSSHIGRLSQGINGLYINPISDDDRNGGVVWSIQGNLEVPGGDFIQNNKSLGSISISPSNNKLLIKGTNREQLNKTIESYPHVINRDRMLILQDGKVIEYAKLDESHKDISENYLENRKPQKEIILALMVLLIFTFTVFILYYKKVK